MVRLLGLGAKATIVTLRRLGRVEHYCLFFFLYLFLIFVLNVG